MRYARPFHVLRSEQYSADWAHAGGISEAVCFDRRDVLDPQAWSLAQTNLRDAAVQGDVTFHFPVNNANYVHDLRLRSRLWEVIDFLDEIGALGLVLHSNMTRERSHWTASSIDRAKAEYANFLPLLADRMSGRRCWLGLENMPIMGNDYSEYDPVLVYPNDFTVVIQSGLGLTWDLCHYSYTRCITDMLADGSLASADYPHWNPAASDDIWHLSNAIRHAHFSAFSGFASPAGRRCTEGVLPSESTPGEEVYRRDFIALLEKAADIGVSFEVAEDDYTARTRFPAIVAWADRLVASSSHRVATRG